ncbi:MAG TPA: FKBP-type peptidyl-prolyl cis-trans isomerase [Allosphingosinicella sp.]|jgi:FKBP-type peptidyl-prolyl cis-trans isomerase FkpA
MSVTAVPIRSIKRGSLVKLWVGLGALCLIAAGIAWAGTRDQVAKDPGSYLESNAERAGVITTASGLQYQVIKEGTGITPGPNDMVLVEYEGRLADGTVFDASARHGGPAPLPVSGVIPGWSEALMLMKKGGKYRLWIPPELGYGPQGAGDGAIPANAVLDFDVTLVDVAPQAAMGAPGMGAPPPPPPPGM